MFFIKLKQEILLSNSTTIYWCSLR